MHLTVYMSEYNGKAEDIDQVLADITKVAQERNKKKSITGVLFYLNGQFLQILEGQEGNIQEIMDSIKADERHKDVEIFINTPVESRSFKDWYMDSFILGEGRIFDRATLKNLTNNFEENFLPRADILIYFYKALLQEKAA